MSIFLVALLPVIGWGTWLSVAQNVRSANPRAKTLYATLANLLASAVIFRLSGAQWDIPSFWPVFLGGVLWSIAGVTAFAAADRIGLARGVGIWIPVNLVVGLAWGIFLFKELAGASQKVLALTAVSSVILGIGVLLILFARRGDAKPDKSEGRRLWSGIFLAAIAGIFWGTYFIPIRASGASAWSAALPMSMGMAVGSLVLTLMYPAPPKLEKPRHYLLAGISGLLWSAGNYGMLMLAERIGTGRGFSVAQLNIIINAILGIYVFRDPPPRTRAARIALAGCLVAAAGGVLLGLTK